MTKQSFPNDDEVDLSELFAMIWSHKIFIGLVTGLSIFLSVYYVVTADKEYTAKATFQVEEQNSRGLPFSSEFGALASLTGAGGFVNSGSATLLERMTGQEFIFQASQNLKLEDDPFFQTHKPNSIEPLWKSLIKKLIGWQKSRQDERALIQNAIRKNFLDYIKTSESDAGAINISVTHKNPELAAQYANSLMEQTRIMIEEENNKSKDFRLSYLAQTLADSLQDMEIAQNNLKNYALENSTAAQENFIAGSIQLDDLRLELQEAIEFIDVLQKIEILLKEDNLDLNSYRKLRIENELVDDVSFRRILGMSETISAWSWPSLDTVLNVSDTLRDRIKRLEVEIKDIERNAKRFASSAKDLAELTREMKIAEATFTVLTEQVKSQSLVAGFKPETFKVFSFASVPLVPSSPKRNLIIALAAVLGLILGIALSLINGRLKNVFYNRSSIILQAQPILALKSKSLRRIARLSFPKLLEALNTHKPAELAEIAVTVTDKKIIYILDAGGKPSASKVAQLLAIQSYGSGKTVLLLDTSTQLEKKNDDVKIKEIDGVTIEMSENSVDLVHEFDEFFFFTSNDYKKRMELLLSSYDQIFISSNNQETSFGLIAMKAFDPGLVVMARLRKTKKRIIEKIVAQHPISILIHD